MGPPTILTSGPACTSRSGWGSDPRSVVHDTHTKPTFHPLSLGDQDDPMWEGLYLHRQTPTVEVGSDVFLGQSLQQILGKAPEQTAGLGHCRMDTCTLNKLV